MANEAQCIETPTRFARYTVSDATAVPIGTLMSLWADNSITASTGADVFAGIAWEEKTLSDGITEMTVAKNGTWDITCNANAGMTLGNIVSLSGANLIKSATEAEMIIGKIVGKLEETATASEVVRVKVGEII